ncbi:hypothetical protein UABAM_05102 [Candidatus Uabimicrobium amorphum]|uniref:Uncharacterized protein n=2 Tax=Uabimicrobium amorphum TaxID=2596890 RepID=A0A5S9IU79_UABAM|nr:hypothetical protein UABAM_05102 [Candidatus Uabimicrobium amorphum]
MILCCSCCRMPTFGNVVTDTPKMNWFTKPSSQFTVKHITNIIFDNDENNEIDLIGYLMVKNDNFRLLGMNEIGITLFDIYHEINKPLTTVKTFRDLEKYDVLQNIAADIRLLFLSPFDSANKIFTDDKKNTTYVKNNDDGSWIAWKISSTGVPQQITVGKCSDTIKEIRFQLGDGPFFEKAFISYPGITVELEILQVESRDIPDEKFVPGEVKT